MQAIILAGGKGTRIASVVPDLPKPMIKIGDKPFLDILIEYLYLQGVEQFYLSIGHLAHVIIDYFATHRLHDHLKFNIETELLGTGGAILDTIRKLNIKSNVQNIMILNGDSFNLFEAKTFFEHHIKNNNDITILTKKVPDATRYGKVLTKNNLISSFTEKGTAGEGRINAGIYIIKTTLFDQLHMEDKFSFENDILQKFLHQLRVGYFDSINYFIDFGIPEDYYKAINELPSLIIEHQLNYAK